MFEALPEGKKETPALPKSIGAVCVKVEITSLILYWVSLMVSSSISRPVCQHCLKMSLKKVVLIKHNCILPCIKLEDIIF